jgi:hypothetical protein
MLGAAFVQPVAGHTGISSYLIVRDTNNRWYLWTGDEDHGLVEIPRMLACWMRNRPEVEDLPHPRLWFEAASLPVSDLPIGPTIR